MLVLRQYPNFEQLLISLVVTAAFFNALYVLSNYFAANGLDSFPRLVPTGLLHNPIRAGTVYGAIVIIALWHFTKSASLSYRIPSIIIAAVAMLLTLLSQSRGPLLALFVTLGLLVFLKWKAVPRRAWYLGGALLIAFICVIMLNWEDRSRDIYGSSFRLEIWSLSLQKILEHPIFGGGIEMDDNLIRSSDLATASKKDFSHSHNFLLSIWRFSGLVGVILILANLAFLVRYGLKGSGYQPLWALLLIFGCVCLLTNGQYPISRPNEIWFVFWAPFGFILAHACLKPDLPGRSRQNGFVSA